ncbi:MAG: hypothetical protein KGJ35_02685 [Patescibacteria group bacterium]|nr:hypothetical protein [Patescibacteria group bacterium]
MALSEFKNRRKLKRYIYSPLSVIVLSVIVIILGRATFGVYQKYELSEIRLSQANDQLMQVKHEEQNLSASIAELSTASGTEAALRTNFRIVKPGESLAVIIDTATSAPATTTPPRGFWSSVGQWFEKVF